MNCIFCKQNSDSSNSVEHVIPESLGNVDHTLPPGVVCDGCNSYFGRKVEQPLLDTPYFRDQRFRAQIPSKKGRAPRVLGVHLQSLVPVELFPNMDGSGRSIAAAHEKDEVRWIQSIRSSTHGTVVVPIPGEPDERLMSRFLAKVAIEALALRLLGAPGGLREVVEKGELDPIRAYARWGTGVAFWPFHRRQLYPPDFLFVEGSDEPYEVLHEWTFLYVEAYELYLVMALFGVEYAMDLGGPETEGYEKWISLNNGGSPLYPIWASPNRGG